MTARDTRRAAPDDFDPEEHLHVALVTDALESIRALYNAESVSVLPMVDVIQLLLQCPLVIAFFLRGQAVYVSLQDPELGQVLPSATELSQQSPERLLSVLEDEVQLAAWRIVVSRGQQIRRITVERRELDDREHRLLTLLVEGLSPEVREFIAVGLRACSAAGAAQEQLKARDTADDDSPPLSPRLRARVDSAIRTMLDEALADCWSSRLLSPRASGSSPEVPNLFFVTRTYERAPRRDGAFQYSSQICLSHRQRECIRSWSGKRDQPHLVEALETPLGEDARSIADAVFASGVVDFSAEAVGDGRDDPGETPGATVRATAESQLYGALLGRGQRQAFYIPIHVGGAPWVAALTLLPHGGLSAWRHAYTLHRTIVPLLASRVRAATKRAYLRLVAELIVSSIAVERTNAETYEALNAELHSLTRAFPFSGVKVRRIEARDGSDWRAGSPRQLCRLEFFPNKHYTARIEFARDLALDELWSVIDETQRVFAQYVDATYSAVGRAIEFEAHTWTNLSPARRLRQLETDVHDGDLRDLPTRVQDARKEAEIIDLTIENAASALGRPHAMQGWSLPDMLNWLVEHQRSGEPRVVLQVARGAESYTLGVPEVGSMMRLLWNLFSNGVKSYTTLEARECIIALSPDTNGRAIRIAFSNVGVMPRPWLRYVNGQGAYPGTEGQIKGLRIVKADAERLGCALRASVDETALTTTITVTVPTQRGHG